MAGGAHCTLPTRALKLGKIRRAEPHSFGIVLAYHSRPPQLWDMPRDIVVIGGSIGALQPLMAIVKALPASIPASFFVVIHSSPDTPRMLPRLLARPGGVEVSYAGDGEEIRHGRVFVAPPDHHLLLDHDRMQVTRGPRENGFRPAADPLFRTAALHHGPRVIGIVLSGGLSDGTHGLALVKTHGGLAIVQQVEDAFASGMPTSAIRNVEVDHVVPASEIATLLQRLVAEPAASARPLAAGNDRPDPAERGLHALKDHTMPGPPSTFTCPECGGPLWEIAEGALTRFACHVGHSYTPEALTTGLATKVESALWTALRVLEENGAFLRRMEARASGQGLRAIADGYRAKARDVEQRAEVVRKAVVDEVAGAPTPNAEASVPELEASS